MTGLHPLDGPRDLPRLRGGVRITARRSDGSLYSFRQNGRRKYAVQRTVG